MDAKSMRRRSENAISKQSRGRAARVRTTANELVKTYESRVENLADKGVLCERFAIGVDYEREAKEVGELVKEAFDSKGFVTKFVRTDNGGLWIEVDWGV